MVSFNASIMAKNRGGETPALQFIWNCVALRPGAFWETVKALHDKTVGSHVTSYQVYIKEEENPM